MMGRPPSRYIDEYPCNLCGKLFKRRTKFQRFCRCKHQSVTYKEYGTRSKMASVTEFGVQDGMVPTAKAKRRGHE